ncbi:MAG: CDP-alcohol phosphatidyltransferase family protein [Myxococcaceae bacterium]
MADDWRTVPNLITLLRLALLPVFFGLLVTGHPKAAVTCFFVAMASDLLDGLAARVLNQRSRLGALLDPIADKAVLLTGLLSLGVLGRAPWWLVGVVLFRDGALGGGALVVRFRRLELPAAPTRIGKYATFALSAMIVLALAGLTVESAVLEAYTAVMGFIAGLCVVVSTLQYLARFGHLLGFKRSRSSASEGR